MRIGNMNDVLALRNGNEERMEDERERGGSETGEQRKGKEVISLRVYIFMCACVLLLGVGNECINCAFVRVCIFAHARMFLSQ